MNTIFDDIRPYSDIEIPTAMQRIATHPFFPQIAQYIYPKKTLSEVQNILLNCTGISDFQASAMYAFSEQVLKRSVLNFTYSGIEHLDTAKSYLYVSNHRDIVLDSMLSQRALYDRGFRPAEITFGSNLMTSQLVVDIGKSNKMFKVVRGGKIRDFYKNSQHLSDYIRRTITQKKESIWIAQRNGRTKDGNDITDQGIVRMFCMSNTSNLAKSIEDLNIVPIAISYQWEPCDLFKTKELYSTIDGSKYIKQQTEDFTNILTGITQPKGNIHISICKPLCIEEYIQFDHHHSNKFYKHIAALIDQRIYSNYKLWNTNYIAHDIRSGTEKYCQYYTPEEKYQFEQRHKATLTNIIGDKNTISSIFLGIYANSVDKITVI